MDEHKNGKLELIAQKSFPAGDELVRVIDFLNKTLKSKNIILGISKDKATNRMIINIYET